MTDQDDRQNPTSKLAGIHNLDWGAGRGGVEEGQKNGENTWTSKFYDPLEQFFVQ